MLFMKYLTAVAFFFFFLNFFLDGKEIILEDKKIVQKGIRRPYKDTKI